MNDLFQAQLDLEARMNDRGVARYMQQVEAAKASGDASRIKSLQTVIDTAVGPVAEALEDFRRAAAAARGGRRHTALKALQDLDATLVAVVGLSHLIDGIAGKVDAAPLALMIGTTLEREARMAVVAREHEGYAKRLMDDLAQRTRNVAHRRAVVSKVLREKGEHIPTWGTQSCVQVGLKVIELMHGATGLFSFAHRREGKRTAMTLVPTERFTAWVGQLDTKFGLMTPEYLPCIIPPKDWVSNTEGGYHSDNFAYPPTFVKSSNRHYRKVLAKADLSRVFRAVNAIQKTPWQVNRRVLDIAELLVSQGRPLGGLPAMELEALPARPVDIDTNKEALTEWKRAAAKVYDLNRRLSGRRVGTLRALHVAREFVDYNAIYFPHQLDFRGRVYPIPQGLNPQGNDLTKGLLHFAEGHPLDTEEAVKWFFIHGANCFGVDKVSFADRQQWVAENHDHIMNSAENPLDYQWWADADSPFCFLAWAFEYAAWSKNKGSFVSRIPVAMDGSCNGLQHYSAMLRDPRGGQATNLTPSEKPQDIYGEVAKVVMVKLQEASICPADADDEAKQKAEWARKWAEFGIDRKITKRPVMVLPYGGTLLSCLDYVRESVIERGGAPFAEDELNKAASYLGTVVWASIGEVVVAARLAMGWLKKVAGVVSKSGKPIIWTTPVGFPVMQAYAQTETLRIECYVLGERFVPQFNPHKEDTIDARRQANGVAPNFVHSMDAASLIDTVNRALDAGVTSFAMIHDSYGTTAGKSETLAVSLREAFVGMYQDNDVLAQFRDSAVSNLDLTEVPSIPFVGGLDLEDVKKSPYFFA